MNNSNAIVFYDGDCPLCHRSMRFLAKIDRKRVLSFVSLQSEQAQVLLKPYKDLPDSVLFLLGGTLFWKSTAILMIFRQLGGFWAYLIMFKLVPLKLRDALYDLFASRRK